MKQFLFIGLAICLMASCSKTSSGAGNNVETSASQDSVAMAEATQTVEELVSEQPEQEDNFANMIPEPSKLLSLGTDELASLLKKLGYEGSTKKLQNQNGFSEGTSANFNYLSGNKKCEIKMEEGTMEDSGCYNCEIKVKIEGDDQALETFYKKAKGLKQSGIDSYTDVNKTGNTVKISSSGC